jgi:hypothetical protein
LPSLLNGEFTPFSTLLFYLLIKRNDTHGPNFIAPPPDIIDGEEEKEIKVIVAHCGSSSRRSYYVKWKDFPSLENEWMTECQLGNAPNILSDYKSRFNL